MEYINFENDVRAMLPENPLLPGHVWLTKDHISQAFLQSKEVVIQAIEDAHHAIKLYGERKEYGLETIIAGILEKLCFLVPKLDELNINAPFNNLLNILSLLELFHNYQIKGERKIDILLCWSYYATRDHLSELDRRIVAKRYGDILFSIEEEEVSMKEEEPNTWYDAELYADSEDARRDYDGVIDVDANEEDEVKIIDEEEFVRNLYPSALEYYHRVENKRRKREVMGKVEEMLKRNPQ